MYRRAVQAAETAQGRQNRTKVNRLENDSHGGRSVKLGLGGEVEFEQFEKGKEREEWTRLQQSHRGAKGGMGIRVSQLQLDVALGCKKGEQQG